MAEAAAKPQSKIGLILLAFIAFISLGLPDGLLGVAYPSMRADFALDLDALGMLLLAGTTGYLLSSFFSGKIIARLGVGRVLALSCAATGFALLGYTLAPSWGLVVALGIVSGAGAGAIDAGLNTYIAAHHGEGLMQWLHASFGVGITLGPIIMTTGLNVFESWRWGYTLVGVAQVSLAVCFFLTASMWARNGQVDPDKPDAEQRLTDYNTPLTETLRQPWAWVSILLFFLYTGVELTLGVWGYTLLTESRGVAEDVAGLWVGAYWGMFTVGRVVAGLYAGRVGVRVVLRVSLLLALFGAVLVWWNPAEAVSLIGIVMVGFAVAPVFPGFVSSTSARVTARHAANTIGMQISAAGLGASILPSVAGVIASRTSIEAIPVFLVCLITVLLVLYTLSTRRPAYGT